MAASFAFIYRERQTVPLLAWCYAGVGWIELLPANQTMSFLGEQPSPSSAMPGNVKVGAWWNRPMVSLNIKPNIGDRNTLKQCLLSRSNDDKMEIMIIMIRNNVFLISQWRQWRVQNAQPHFCTDTLDRRNYWAEFDEILRGAPWGDNSRYYRGIFGYSAWGSRRGVPLGPPGRLKICS